MGIWQVVWLVWIALALGISLSRHGEPKQGHESFWVALVSAVLEAFVLAKGGFFS